MANVTEIAAALPAGQLAYHILRYVPNLVRDEWVNIGVLVFNPQTGERRLRLIEATEEYNRVRRLHPSADEAVLRALRDDLEDRLDTGGADGSTGSEIPWQRVLSKWNATLSNALQIAPQKGVLSDDLDGEVERLYADHVAIPRRETRPGLPGGRADIRSWCRQVFKQVHIWNHLEKSVKVAEFTFPGDPARLDYSYRRNGTRGFVHAISVTRAPQDAKTLAYNVGHLAAKAPYATEFTAVTDVQLSKTDERHRFVLDTFREVGVEPVATAGLAVWAAKLQTLLLQ